MATSGYFDVYVRKNTEFYRVSWTDTPVSNTNTSKVTVSVKYYSKWKTISSTSKDLKIWIDGTQYTGSGKIGITGWSSTLMSATKTITHGTDGKKSINLRFWGEVNIKYSGKWYTDVDSGSQSIKLTTLDTPSTITVSNSTITVGDNHTFTINRKTSSALHTVTCAISGTSYSWSVLTKSDKYGSVSFTVPKDAMKYMSSKTATVTVTCTTYIGSSNVGSSSGKFTIALPSDATPTLSTDNIKISVSKDSEFSEEFVQGKSKAIITIDGVNYASGSSFKQVVLIINGVTYNLSETTYTTSLLTQSGNNTVKAYIIDNRGCVSPTVSTNFYVYQYNVPIVSSVTASRHDGNNYNTKGTKIMLNASWSFPSLNGLNYTNIKVYIKEKSASSYGDAVLTTSSSGAYSGLLNGDYPSTKSYNIKFVVTDIFDASTTYETMVDTEEAIVDISPYGVAVGKVFEGVDKQFQCQYPAVFSSTAYINNSTLVTSDARYKDVVDNLNNYPQFLELYDKLSLYLFKYKGDTSKINAGILAQDAIKAFDDIGLDYTDYNLVVEHNGGYYVNYDFINILTSLKLRVIEQEIKEIKKRLDV